VRIALYTNNYLPFCGGVTISVETLRRGLEAAGHEPWVFGPRLGGARDALPRVVRYPSIPATTYPEFALAVPYSRRIARLVAAIDFDVFHAHHPFLLGPAARRLARRAKRRAAGPSRNGWWAWKTSSASARAWRATPRPHGMASANSG